MNIKNYGYVTLICEPPYQLIYIGDDDKLKYGNTYISYECYDDNEKNRFILIKLVDSEKSTISSLNKIWFNINQFVTIEEFRNKRINEILNK